MKIKCPKCGRFAKYPRIVNSKVKEGIQDMKWYFTQTNSDWVECSKCGWIAHKGVRRWL